MKPTCFFILSYINNRHNTKATAKSNSATTTTTTDSDSEAQYLFDILKSTSHQILSINLPNRSSTCALNSACKYCVFPPILFHWWTLTASSPTPATNQIYFPKMSGQGSSLLCSTCRMPVSQFGYIFKSEWVNCSTCTGAGIIEVKCMYGTGPSHQRGKADCPVCRNQAKEWMSCYTCRGARGSQQQKRYQCHRPSM